MCSANFACLVRNSALAYFNFLILHISRTVCVVFMNNKDCLWLSITVLVIFPAVGIPYWLIPYSSVSLPNALLAPNLSLVILGALLLRLRSVSTFAKVVAGTGATVPAVVLVRVLWEGFQDPTTHNLWPLELIIALALGFFCALLGAAVGSLLSTLLQR